MIEEPSAMESGIIKCQVKQFPLEKEILNKNNFQHAADRDRQTEASSSICICKFQIAQ